MAEYKVIKEQMHTECSGDCDTVCSFLKLTDEMIKTILELDEELIRWRQTLIKYLPPEWAEDLQQDIFNNISRDFEGDPAYDLYVRLACGGQDPQQEASRIARLHRLSIPIQ